MADKKTNVIKKKRIYCGKGDFLFDESFNSLAINLKYIAKQDDCAVAAITSYYSGEGKSTVTYNLAYTLAQQGRRVLIIDADLRRGRLHRYFGEERANGLTDYLCGLKTPAEIVRKTKIEGLSYVSAGATTMNPIKLLDRKELGTLISVLRKNYDWILVDTAPLGMVSDSLLVMRVVDGAVLVADHKKSKKHDISRAVEVLNVSKVDILGFVINNADNIRTPGRGRYSRYSRYGYYLVGKKAEPTATTEEKKESK